MPETKRMAEEAARMAQEAQEQAKTVGQEYQSAVECGFEAASRSFANINSGFLAIATRDDQLLKETLRGCFAVLGATPPCAIFRRRRGSSNAVCPKSV